MNENSTCKRTSEQNTPFDSTQAPYLDAHIFHIFIPAWELLAYTSYNTLLG
jgi:hypothetical protein